MGALDLLVLINSQPSACQKEKKKTNGIQEPTNALGFLRRGVKSTGKWR